MYVLGQINDSGATRWVLSHDGTQIKEWYYAPLLWVFLSCLVHGRIVTEVHRSS